MHKWAPRGNQTSRMVFASRRLVFIYCSTGHLFCLKTLHSQLLFSSFLSHYSWQSKPLCKLVHDDIRLSSSLLGARTSDRNPPIHIRNHELYHMYIWHDPDIADGQVSPPQDGIYTDLWMDQTGPRLCKNNVREYLSFCSHSLSLSKIDYRFLHLSTTVFASPWAKLHGMNEINSKTRRQ